MPENRGWESSGRDGGPFCPGNHVRSLALKRISGAGYARNLDA